MNSYESNESSKIKRRRQIQLLECITRVVEIYIEHYQSILTVEFQQLFSTILNKGIQSLLLYGIYLAGHRNDKDIIEVEYQNRYKEEQEQLEQLKNKLSENKDIVYDWLMRDQHLYSENEAKLFYEKIQIATHHNTFDVTYFEPLLKHIFQDVQTINQFLLNQKGPYIFKSNRPFLEFSALISIICINQFQFDRDISYKLIKMIHLDHLQDIIRNPLEFLNSPALQQ